MHTDTDHIVPSARPLRRWRSVRQLAERLEGAFSEAAIRALIYRAESHYDRAGELVPGNGLAACIARPGGKGSRVLIDEDGSAAWLENGCVYQRPEAGAAHDSGAAVRTSVAACSVQGGRSLHRRPPRRDSSQHAP